MDALAQLAQLLSNALSHDPAVMRAAEMSLAQAKPQPGYGPALAEISRSAAVEEPIRQLSAVLLKGLVAKHWSEEMDSSDEEADEDEPEKPAATSTPSFFISDADKAALRRILLEILSDSSTARKVMTQVAVTITSIATVDFPEEWPELLSSLLALLHPSAAPSSESDVTNFKKRSSASLACLAVMAEDFTDSHMGYLMPTLVPQMLRILRSPYSPDASASSIDSFSLSGRGCAFSVLCSILKLLHAMAATHVTEVRSSLTSLIPEICTACSFTLSSIRSPSSAASNGSIHQVQLMMDIFKIVNKLAAEFTKQSKDNIATILTDLWGSMQSTLSFVNAFVIEGNDVPAALLASETVFQPASTEEEYKKSLTSLTYQQFEFLRTLTLEKQKEFKAFTRPFLPPVIQHIMHLLAIEKDQIDAWTEDVSQYVVSEEEDAFEYTIRIAGRELLRDLVEAYSKDEFGPKCVWETATSMLASSTASSGNPSWWKLREAALLSLELIAEQIAESSSSYPVSSLAASQILPIDLSPSSAPELLRARALSFLSRIPSMLPDFPTDQLHSLMNGLCVQSLESSVSPIVKMAAIRSIGRLSREENESVQKQLLPHLGGILLGVCNVIASSSKDALRLSLETLEALLSIDDAITATLDASFVMQIFQTWSQTHSDHLCIAILEEIIKILADASPAICAVMESSALPTVLSIIQAPVDSVPFGLVRSAIVLVMTIARRATSQSAVTSAALEPVLNLLCVTDDNKLILDCCQCARVLLRVGHSAVVSESERLLPILLKAMSRVLDPTLPEAACINSGKLLITALNFIGTQLQPYLFEMMKATINRLAVSKTASMIQSLVLFFAHLTISHSSSVIEFLTSLPITNPKDGSATTGFQILMQHWTENQEAFYGSHDLKISSSALARLLASQHPAVLATVLTVERTVIVAPEAAGRQTRSKAKATKRTIHVPVPLPVRIFTLCAKQLFADDDEQNELAESAARAAAGKEDSSDDDDEEGEDIDIGGKLSINPFTGELESKHFKDDLFDFGERGDDDEDDEAGDDEEDESADPFKGQSIRNILVDTFRPLSSQPAILQTLAAELSAEEVERLSSFLQ